MNVPVFLRCLNAKNAERLIAECEAFVSASVLQGPILTILSGEKGRVSDLIEIPLVGNGAVVRGQYESAVQPLVSLYEGGISATVVPTLTENGRVRFDRLSLH